MTGKKHEDGESTRRALVVTSGSALSPDDLIKRINEKTEWKASQSESFDVVVEKDGKKIELKSLGDQAFRTVNVSPQDAEHRHVPIEEDTLSELAPVLESLDTTVSWVLADKDKIKTVK